MDVPPDRLRAAARRWDGVADELAAACSLLRGAPTGGPGPAAGEAARFVEEAAAAVSRLRDDVDGIVDALLLTAGLVADTDDRVAAALEQVSGWP